MVLTDFTRPIPFQLRREYTAAGYATEASLGHLLVENAQRWPHEVAVVDIAKQPVRLTNSELLSRVQRLVSALRQRGVKGGDVVVVKSPNRSEVLIACWAAWHLGCVLVPIVDIYGEHEIRQILQSVSPAVLVCDGEEEGSIPSLSTLDGLLDEQKVISKVKLLIGGEYAGWTSYAEMMTDDGAHAALALTNVDDPALVLFTSGTTSAPKGVVHSARTLIADARQCTRVWGVNHRDRGFLPLPIAHIAGVEFGMVIPAFAGCSVVLSRMTSLARAAEEILEHHVTYVNATPRLFPYVAKSLGEMPHSAMAIRSWSSGGSALDRADLQIGEDLGINPFRLYGMTECPSVTASSSTDSQRDRLETDGLIAPGVQCEAVDPATREGLGIGQEGELRVRGPERLLGYLNQNETELQIDSEGWFYTGDVGIVDDRGCVTISGRLKDIINRGGEKFSARDIEEVLRRHASISEVAVVAAPDRRYGEVPAAFVVLSDGERMPSAEVLADHLRYSGMARQKMPVHWRVVSELPRTGSGKVKKNELRDEVSKLGQSDALPLASM